MDKELKHTPGPWTTGSWSGPKAMRIATEWKPQRHIADVFHSPYFSEDKEEMRANALLIAAAPDLLRQRDELLIALKAMIAVEDSRFEKENHGLADGVELTDLTAARAAIAQAEKGQA